jgi:hypothetical protein
MPTYTQSQSLLQGETFTDRQANAPTPLAAPKAPPTITTVGPNGKTITLPVPTTRADVRELTARRQQISDQLTNVSSRRGELASEIRGTIDPVSISGLQDRLRLLDQRILQLENDLAVTGQQLAAAPSQLTAGTEERPSGGSDSFEEGLMAGGFSVLLIIPILFYFARRRWRRVAPASSTRIGPESARLQRLEQGMEAIAIEIERISEGQRFVTKLLSESQTPPATSRRIPEPVGVIEPDPTKR